MAIFTSGLGVGLDGGGGGTIEINLIEAQTLEIDKNDNVIFLENDSTELVLERVGRDIEFESESVQIDLEKLED